MVPDRVGSEDFPYYRKMFVRPFAAKRVYAFIRRGLTNKGSEKKSPPSGENLPVEVEHSTCKEVANDCRDLRSTGLGCEVARVEKTNRRAGNVVSERLGAPRQKERIVLSPYGQEMWFVCPEVILESWVECDVTPVVAEQIQQNLVGARAGQIGLRFMGRGTA
jgi:hypothetical protein